MIHFTKGTGNQLFNLSKPINQRRAHHRTDFLVISRMMGEILKLQFKVNMYRKRNLFPTKKLMMKTGKQHTSLISLNLTF